MVYEISRESNQQRRKYSSQRSKNDKGECITSRKGIADVFGEFYKKTLRGQRENEVNDDDN